MKNRILSLVAALACAATSFAQMANIATLNHNGKISAFYGADALISAMEAADHGDIISLSSGRFNAADITKAVTLRGTGMFSSTDTENPHDPTLVVNNCTISIADSVPQTLKIEGINFCGDHIDVNKSLNNAQFSKCKFHRFSIYDICNDLLFTSCRIIGSFSVITTKGKVTATFINSLLYNCGINSNSAFVHYFNFTNCFIGGYISGGNAKLTNTYNNCVFCPSGSYSNNRINQYSSATNCVAIIPSNASTNVSDFFEKMASGNTTNKYVSEISSFFKYYTYTDGTFNDSSNFELTKTAAATYLGTDGTQVGIYGGSLPYEEAPLLPQITKCQVASRTTADGKLSVDIEVKAADY